MVHVVHAVSEVVAVAAEADGVVGIVLGGSRGAGTADEHSDWGIGVHYRGLDHVLLSVFGDVHLPGARGRIMNGGARLRNHNVRIDVVFRDVVGRRAMDS